MGKALKALKTWLELSAEHLEQSNDLDIVLLSYPIVFPLPPATQWPKSLLKHTSVLSTHQHWKMFQSFRKTCLAGKSLK